MIYVLIFVVFAYATRSVYLQRKLRRTEKIADGGFLLAFSGLLAKVAMADGAVTADEVEIVEGFFSKMGLSRAERAMCIGNFLLAQREKDGASEDADALAKTLNHIACQFLYGLLWRVANADRRISESEERLLKEAGEALGLNGEERACFHAGGIPTLDRQALEAAGVPPALVCLSRADGGAKGGSLDIWNR